MTTRNRFPGERGFSLVEMMIALVVFSVVAASALAVFRGQSRAFRLGGDRMAALQNVRFAMELLETDLRTLGTGTLDYQPFVVYAASDVVVFNANAVSNVRGDPFAVYYDPDAPAGAVSALLPSQAIAVPNGGFNYPDTSYVDASGTNSPAETMAFYLRLDSSTARTDDYVLFKQVNAQPAALVARNILRTGSLPFFQYFALRRTAGQPIALVQVPDTVPLRHVQRAHLSTLDTGQAARVDSIRGLRVNLTGTNGLTGPDERRRTLSRMIRFPNAGLAQKQTCGDEPLLSGALAAVPIVRVDGTPAVRLTWSAALDEGGGEKDVVRYVVWRRAPGAPDWGDGYVSIPAGQANYVYEDGVVQSGTGYQYALAAQDCTPSLSSLSSTGTITIP